MTALSLFLEVHFTSSPAVHLGINCIQILLSGMTFRRFPELAAQQTSQTYSANVPDATPRSSSFTRWLRASLDPRDMIRDFKEFRKLPVFYSSWCSIFSAYNSQFIAFAASLSIASIYLTVTSTQHLFLIAQLIRNDLRFFHLTALCLHFSKARVITPIRLLQGSGQPVLLQAWRAPFCSPSSHENWGLCVRARGPYGESSIYHYYLSSLTISLGLSSCA